MPCTRSCSRAWLGVLMGMDTPSEKKACKRHASSCGPVLCGPASEDTRRINHTQGIAKRIVQVERSLAPRTTNDLAHGKATVTDLRRQVAKALSARKDGLEIVHCKVDVIE